MINEFFLNYFSDIVFVDENPCTITSVQKYNESGELKSDRCYSEDDYYDIQRLYSDYKFEVGTIDFIESRIEITCDGSDFFKSSCEDAKKDLSDQKKLIEDLKSKIRKIISRGK